MKHPLDNKTVDWVEESNAVLTPHLIHPNYLKIKWQTGSYKHGATAAPATQAEINARKRWCEIQLNHIGEFGAVFGEVK